MSTFARSRVARIVDGGKLQDLVEAAVGSDVSDYFGRGGGGGGGDVFSDNYPRAPNGGAAGNGGWDW